MDRWTDGRPDGWMDVSLYSCHMYCVYSFTEFQKHQLPEGYKQYPEVRSNLGHNRCLWDPINFQGFTREFVIRQEKWRVLAGGTKCRAGLCRGVTYSRQSHRAHYIAFFLEKTI